MPSHNERLSIALKFTLRWEGGYVNHPADPRGATNKGVTKKVYDADRASKGLGRNNLRNITDDEVYDSYENGYWARAKCPSLAVDLDRVQFDTAINMSVGPPVHETLSGEIDFGAGGFMMRLSDDAYDDEDLFV